jgi:multimeric flavodoxin WrbA
MEREVLQMTQVLILKGSPRPKGNSAVLAEQVRAGAEGAGAKVESVYLHGLDIQPCDGCYFCEGTGVCVIEDDMQALYPKLRRADAIVIASPVYWFTYSAQVKLCVDRWVALETPDGNELGGKKIGIVLTYGDTDIFTSGGINAIHSFQSMFGYIGAEIVGYVYGTGDKPGEVKDQPELMERALKLGQQLASKGIEPAVSEG